MFSTVLPRVSRSFSNTFYCCWVCSSSPSLSLSPTFSLRKKNHSFLPIYVVKVVITTELLRLLALMKQLCLLRAQTHTHTLSVRFFVQIYDIEWRLFHNYFFLSFFPLLFPSPFKALSRKNGAIKSVCGAWTQKGFYVCSFIFDKRIKSDREMEREGEEKKRARELVVKSPFKCGKRVDCHSHPHRAPGSVARKRFNCRLSWRNY